MTDVGNHGICGLCRIAGPVKSYKGAARSELLCAFCGASLVANALFYPEQHIGKFYLYHGIMYVGHKLFRELRRVRRALERLEKPKP